MHNNRTNGNGLNNIKKRMDAIGGSVEFASNEKGTNVTLHIPL
jgi:signal transduction histidine kinase